MVFKKNWEYTQLDQIPDNLVGKILQSHFSHKSILEISPLKGGCANLNFLLTFHNSQSPPIILRIYVRDVNSVYLEKKLSGLLHSKLPVPKFIQLSEIEGYTYALVEYKRGVLLRDFLSTCSVDHLDLVMRQVGRCLGTFAQLDFNKKEIFNKNSETLSQESLLGFFIEHVVSPYFLDSFFYITPLFFLGDILLGSNTLGHYEAFVDGIYPSNY